MWFTMFRTWKPGNLEVVRQLVEMEKSAEVVEEMGTSYETRGIFEARVHGNPRLGTGQVLWYEDAGVLGSQVGSYKLGSSLDYFKLVGDSYAYTDGHFLIDVDDPELLELGELGVHERLTRWLPDFLAEGRDDPEWSDEFMEAIDHYTDNCFFCNIESAEISASGLVVECFRHKLGFPYEWYGAPID